MFSWSPICGLWSTPERPAGPRPIWMHRYEWPPPRGWKLDVIGKEISRSRRPGIEMAMGPGAPGRATKVVPIVQVHVNDCRPIHARAAAAGGLLGEASRTLVRRPVDGFGRFLMRTPVDRDSDRIKGARGSQDGELAKEIEAKQGRRPKIKGRRPNH